MHTKTSIFKIVWYVEDLNSSPKTFVKLHTSFQDCRVKHGGVLRFAYCRDIVENNTDTIVQELKRGKTIEQICGQLSRAAVNHLPNYKQLCMKVATETERYASKHINFYYIKDVKNNNYQVVRFKFLAQNIF